MTEPYIAHKDIAAFADEHVNLKRDDAKKYREQVNRLRDKLDQKLEDEPDFDLKRMMLSGSLAKGSALKQINDIDVALYVQQDDPPNDMPKFIDWLVDTLRSLYPNMDEDQITPQDHSVCISFKGTGLDVDIVPISYDGNSDWNGYLYSTARHGHVWVLTNIDKHLEFIGERKKAAPPHFIQVVRLLKYWVSRLKKEDDNFKFKSMLVELILAHLADNRKIELDNYVEAMMDFFDYIIKSELDAKIVFDDYYSINEVGDDSAPIRVYDPVNPDNNVAESYDASHKEAIIEAANEAADAIAAAALAPTQSEAIRYWQKVFGASFGR